MVNKITVYPEGVRGLGDIVSPKSVSDFDCYNSNVVVDGSFNTDTVYKESFLNGSYFIVTYPKVIGLDDTSFSVSGVLYYNTGNVLYSTPVKCIVNAETVLETTTGLDGRFNFNISVSDVVDVYKVKLVHVGNSNVAGCFKNIRTMKVNVTTLDLIAVPDIVQLDENSNLLATLHGTSIDGETIGVPGQTVNFYETYNPALGVNVDKSIIQTGETSNITVQLKDADDGSLVRQDNILIKLYQFVKGISPALDGTENVVSWTSLDNITGDGVFRTHGGYLDEGWNNTGNWVLNFDYRYVTGNYSATKYIGLMPICSSEINPYTDAEATNYAITCWEGGFGFTGLGRTEWITSPGSTPSVTQTDWNHIQITKLSSTRLQIVLNDTYTWIGEFPNLENLETLYIGSRDNPADRNKGGYVEYKEISVEVM